MSDPDEKQNAPSDSEPVSLEGFELTPDWVKGPTKQFNEPTAPPRRTDPRRRRPGPRRDGKGGPPRGKHPSAPPHQPQSKPAGKGRPPKPRRSGPPPRRSGAPPEPLPLEVTFLPEETGFAAMMEKMKQTHIAYALFDLAKLVLAKPQRYQVQIAREVGADGARLPLYRVVKSNQPYLNRQAATAALMNRHAELVAREVRTEVEPPKGSFTFVNRCGMTGAWLGPPNYHEYQAVLVRHHQERLRQVPFEKFKARIETVHDEAAVEQWRASVSTKLQYACVLHSTAAPAEAGDNAGNETTPAAVAPEAPLFDSLTDLEKHVVEQHLDELVTTVPELTIEGVQVPQLEHRGIFHALRQAWETERRFPIKTVNALRPRLQKAGFHFFKHPDGVVYLTQARLKRFDAGAPLSDEVKQILALLRQGGGMTSPQLMAALLPTPPAEPAPASGSEPEPATEDAPAAVAPDDPPTPEKTGETPATSQTTVRAEEEPVLAELHWLIDEGYVIELSDGRLWATPEKSPPPAEPAEPPQPAAAAENNAAAAEQQETATPSPVPAQEP